MEDPAQTNAGTQIQGGDSKRNSNISLQQPDLQARVCSRGEKQKPEQPGWGLRAGGQPPPPHVQLGLIIVSVLITRITEFKDSC